MKYRAYSLPLPTVGEDYTNVIELTVPDQSMSLQYIIERFTRGEKLAVDNGSQGNYFDGDEDLEKLSMADLVDRAEYADKLRQVKIKFDRQEAAKKARQDKLAFEEAVKRKTQEMEAQKGKTEDSSGSAK